MLLVAFRRKLYPFLFPELLHVRHICRKPGVNGSLRGFHCVSVGHFLHLKPFCGGFTSKLSHYPATSNNFSNATLTISCGTFLYLEINFDDDSKWSSARGSNPSSNHDAPCTIFDLWMIFDVGLFFHVRP